MRYAPVIVVLCTTFALVLSLASPQVRAEEYPFDASLYDAEHITVVVVTHSNITLTGSGTAQELRATVNYVPEEAQSIDATPIPSNEFPLTFSWSGLRAGTYPFSVGSTVNNAINKPRITQKIPYPFSSPQTVTSYLLPQEITDTSSQIRANARQLASGESDALVVVWNIAEWVKQNVKYDLNSVTAQASKTSTWVYKNREGVCDELTSLFISLSREAGIPARFVSGYAYTNLPGFPDHWGPHGWAEVWLPDTGWVPVDVTYGQVGYVDATHIPITHSLDAKNTAVSYELRARELTMEPGELTTKATVLAKEGEASEPLHTKLTPLYDNTGSFSGNLLRATIENTASYYVATDVYLASTKETTVLDEKSQGILLPPKSTRTVSWRVKMPSYERGYVYTVPFTAIVQRADNATTAVKGSLDAPQYPLLAQAQEPTALTIDCETPPPLYPGEQATVQCFSPGNRLCAQTCAQEELTLSFTAAEPGAYPHVVRAIGGSDTGSAVVTFIVEELPSPSITVTMPQQVPFADSATLAFTIATATLTDVTVTATSAHFQYEWNLDKLQSKSFELAIPATTLNAGENSISVTVTGKDKNKNLVTKTAQTTTTVQATFWERIQLFFLHALG